MKMKTLLVAFFLLGFRMLSYAQEKPVYFHGDKIIEDKKNATFYGVYGKLSTTDIYALKVYDIYNNLVRTGTYKDEGLEVPHGKFSYYAYVDIFNEHYRTEFSMKKSDRFLSEQGKYNDGNKHGVWITFYPDGKVKSIVTYSNGFKHGETSLLDTKGNLLISGSYKLNEKDSVWNYYNEGLTETYANGLLQYKKYN